MSLKKINKKKFYTGVAFAPEVAKYVDQIAERMGWNRSVVIDFIIREHARQSGHPPAVPAFDVLLAQRELSSK
jgi:hypothetical protein